RTRPPARRRRNPPAATTARRTAAAPPAPAARRAVPRPRPRRPASAPAASAAPASPGPAPGRSPADRHEPRAGRGDRAGGAPLLLLAAQRRIDLPAIEVGAEHGLADVEPGGQRLADRGERMHVLAQPRDHVLRRVVLAGVPDPPRGGALVVGPAVELV